jgi:sporulation protein YlmC with PRC-barrel domain
VMTASEDALKAAPAYGETEANLDSAPMTGAPASDMAQTDMSATTPPVATDPAAEAPAPGAMADATMSDTTSAATPDPAMPAAGATADAGAAASTDMTAPSTGTDMAMTTPEGYMAAEPDQMTAEALTGTAVYGSDNEKIGEIGKLLLDGSGQITEAVIDVGGFLGLGEKPVALPIDQINIVKATEGDELRVYVGDTKDQLKAMPAYEG